MDEINRILGILDAGSGETMKNVKNQDVLWVSPYGCP